MVDSWKRLAMDLDLTEREQKIALRLHREKEISGWIGFSLAMLMIAAAGILAYQAFQFLRLGEWPSLRWSDAFGWAGPLDMPRGRGVEKILRWIGALPLFLLPLALLGLSTFWFTDKAEDSETRSVRMKLANAEYRRAKGD